MHLGRGKYNLLQYQKRGNPQLEVPDWQIRDYRALSEGELVAGIQKFGKEFPGGANSPEEWAETLPEEAYLYVFELWRRYFPSQRTLTLFCDDLDAFIEGYPLVEQEDALLTELFDILDESVDEGEKPKKVFKSLNLYLAHDLEEFFYNYIYDQIDQGNEVGASELLENIYDYIEGNLWFDFLRIRLLQGVPVEDATAILARFLEQIRANPDIELFIELLYYLVETGHNELFTHVYKEAIKQIQTEEQFLEMLEVIFSYYTLNDLEKEETLIRQLIQERKKLPLSQKVLLQDKDKLGEMIR